VKFTPEEFVKMWQTAGSMDELVASAEMKSGDLQNRAKAFRKRGIPLKQLSVKRGRNIIDVAKLKALAESFNQDIPNQTLANGICGTESAK
jgi:hypothetical protein